MNKARVGCCALAAAALLAACGGDSAAVPGETATTSSPPTTAEAVRCSLLNFPPVDPPRDEATGAFTHAPFVIEDVAARAGGGATDDAGVASLSIKRQGSEIPIYAPADGVLFRIRYTAVPPGAAEHSDYDLFFAVSCDAYYRFDHVTDPRPDIVAAYQYGDEPAEAYNDDGTVTEYEAMQVPTRPIAVRAGDLLGHTRGTAADASFGFAVAIAGAAVCPSSVFAEPVQRALADLLGGAPTGRGSSGDGCNG